MRRIMIASAFACLGCWFAVAAAEPKREREEKIGDLQARLGKRADDFGARLARGERLPENPVGIRGDVIQLLPEDKKPRSFALITSERDRPVPVQIFWRKEVRVFYSDGRKAEWSDLKPGQHVVVGGRIIDLFSSPLKAEADAVFIDKTIREIYDPKDAAAIARQVDFASEELLLFRWQGFGGFATDRLSFKATRDKGGPLVVFKVTRPRRLAGMAEVPEITNVRLYALAKGTRVTGGPTPGTKITNAAELEKAFPGVK